MIWNILLTGLVSSLTLAAVHLGLRYWLKQDVHVVWRYVMGTTAMYIPLTVLNWTHPQTDMVVAMWVVLFLTGFTVGGLYLLGDWVEKHYKVKEGGERERKLEEKIYGRSDEFDRR